jgi:DNA-binding NarL/FixJ family response regulator
VAGTTPSTSPRARGRTGAAIDSQAAAGEDAVGLTERELEVLLELVRGGSNQEIAKDLGISVKTVGHHVQNIYRKADVHSRAAATRWAFEHDLV